MSFSSLIDKLSTLVSKAYVFSAFIPVLVFAFLNASLLWFHSLLFQHWAAAQLAKPSAFTLTSIVVGLVVAGYMLQSVNTFLREFLEGKYIPGPLRARFVARQQAMLNDLWGKYTSARDDQLDISRSIPGWRDTHPLAAKKGIDDHKGHNIYDRTNDVAVRVNQLRQKRDAAETISYQELEGVVHALEEILRENDENTKGRADDAAASQSQLKADRFFLLDLFDYAQSALIADENRFLNERQYRFGFVAEPTAMGNVVASVQAWAMIRYSMNLNSFWSRLQPGLQADANFYTVLQDAKVQLDFLVACCWLATLTWIGWTIALAAFRTSLVAWILVALGGPFVSRFFYELAVTNYMAFGDIMRTSVDLYRFTVLRAMHVPIPRSIREERLIWGTLQKLTIIGQEDVELTYAQDKPKAPAT